MLGVQATVWDRLSPDFGGVLKRRCLREVVHGSLQDACLWSPDVNSRRQC